MSTKYQVFQNLIKSLEFDCVYLVEIEIIEMTLQHFSKPRFLLLVCLLGLVKGDCDGCTEHNNINVLESTFGPVLDTRFGEYTQATNVMIEEKVKSELEKQDRRMMEKMDQMQTAFLQALEVQKDYFERTIEEQGKKIKDLINDVNDDVRNCPPNWFNIQGSCIFIGGRRKQDTRPIANTGKIPKI